VGLDVAETLEICGWPGGGGVTSGVYGVPGASGAGVATTGEGGATAVTGSVGTTAETTG
jgi:hypothetical protein